MTNKLKPWLLLALVFLAGAVTGVIGTRMVVRQYIARARTSPDWMVQRMERELTSALALNPEQKAEVRNILLASQQQVRAVRREMQPRFVAIFRESERQIAEQLTPEQRMKFQRYLRERRGQFTFVRPPPFAPAVRKPIDKPEAE